MPSQETHGRCFFHPPVRKRAEKTAPLSASSTAIAIQIPGRPSPKWTPSSQAPATATSQQETIPALTGSLTSPAATRLRTITIFTERPISRKNSMARIVFPSLQTD